MLTTSRCIKDFAPLGGIFILAGADRLSVWCFQHQGCHGGILQFNGEHRASP